jgi:protein ImuB
MSLWLPNWPIERRRRQGGAPVCDRPFLLIVPSAGKRLVAAADEAAITAGIVPGMTLADARALRPDLTLAAADCAGDAAGLADLVRWCNRFSPWTAPCGSDGLWLDVTGCAHLFGDEAGLASAVVERLAGQGISCRAAIADSAGAAWAMAHFGGARLALVPSGGTLMALRPLPVAALRLEPEAAVLLVRLGLRQIGDLYALPRAALAARCGEAVMLRLDQALGLAAEPLSPVPPAPLRWTRRSFAEPVTAPEALAAATRELLATLCRRLAAEALGAQQLVLTLYRVDGELAQAAIGMALPSREPRHLWRLIEEQFPSLDPGLGIEDMVLTATAVGQLAAAQLELVGGGEGPAQMDLARLVDRLANRLGPRAPARPLPRESHVPERVVDFAPVLGNRAVKAVWDPAKPRPVRLLARPEPIEVVAPLPDDPPLLFRWRRQAHRVRRSAGPERIADEWWREIAAPRDYYQVEDEAGRRFWLYRAGLYDAETLPRWFLHGFFA